MFLLWIAVIIAIVGLVQAFDRMRRLEQTAEELRRTLERLTRRLDEGAVPVAAAKASAATPKPVRSYERPAIESRPALEEELPVEDEAVGRPKETVAHPATAHAAVPPP